MDEPLRLRAAIGKYSHTEALLSGRIASDALLLEFADIPTINRAFAPMVREARFDVCEMAIATFLQARAYDKPLVLLPVTLAARFQEGALLCRTDSDIAGPADLVGRRVGVRAYSQTTGMWLRGVLAEMHGVQAQQVRWVTFEDAHVPEVRDPPWAERAAAGSDMLAMLRAGELDAVIVGNDVPDDPGLRTVFKDPQAAARQFWDAHRLVPVNHLVCVRRTLVQSHPWIVPELLGLFGKARDAAGLTEDQRLAVATGRAQLTPAVTLALRYAQDQGMLPRHLEPTDVWDPLAATS